MRDLVHRILFVAGTMLLAAAVIYGAPSRPAWSDSEQGHRPLRMASGMDLPSLAGPLRGVLKRLPAHRTDTVKPNGASCPGGESLAQNSPAAPSMPNGAVASPCPANGSDARADIARGHAIATPEPLNSKELIAPGVKSPG